MRLGLRPELRRERLDPRDMDGVRLRIESCAADTEAGLPRLNCASSRREMLT